MMNARVVIAFVLLISSTPLAAQSDGQQLVDRLIDRIVANEQDFLTRFQKLEPIIETYVQESPDNPDSDGQPVNDEYFIGRLSWQNGVNVTPFWMTAGFQDRAASSTGKGASGTGTKQRFGIPLFRSSALYLLPAGFAQMVIIDDAEFNRNTYSFEYVRRDFLGDVRSLVFDVTPRSQAPGKFIGRIWVEDRDYRIIRFNGIYTGSKRNNLFFHFDTWRTNVAPNLWVPAFVYVEEKNPMQDDKRKTRFRAQSRLWGYDIARHNKLDELTSILVEAESGVRDESEDREVSPLESSRMWQRQAESNVTDRLEKSGLLAPKGDVDEVLNTVVNNLMVTNGINLDVRCRVLLSTPLETFSIGRTIIISRGLIDVLPDETSLAMVLSGELAHIALGHHTETVFAFSDQTMFDERETLNRLRMSRSVQEMESANEKAMKILANSPYKDNLSAAGLFLKALASRGRNLPNLIRANLGNELAGTTGLVRFAELISKAPNLEEKKLEQIAALPVGSRVKLDPWTNQITLVKARSVALLSPREKMPFEITPFLIPLSRVGTEPARQRAATPPESERPVQP